MTAVDVDALEAARAAAMNPPPWAVNPHDGQDIHNSHGSSHAEAMFPEDASLIVAAVNVLPDLLAAVRERDALRAAVEGLATFYDGGGDGVPRLPGRGATSNAYVAKRLSALLAVVDGGQR